MFMILLINLACKELKKILHVKDQFASMNFPQNSFYQKYKDIELYNGHYADK